jgi:hypothetical protein
MSSFPIRPLEIWRSSLAQEIVPIRGVFEFEVLDSSMVMQTLDFLREWRPDAVQPSGEMEGFISAMGHYQPAQNRLWYRMDFENSDELFNFEPLKLYRLVRNLEIFADINFTINTINYLANVGGIPRQLLMSIRRRPIARGVAFEVGERGEVRSSLLAGDLSISDKIELAQQHYSTAMTLLAAEDQLSGLLDGAFMQFYLAIETILEEHVKEKALQKGGELFGNGFDSDLKAIVDHVYVARHRFFGHAHHKWRKGMYDPEIAFQIAKQTLVARWCARQLIALGLGRDLVHREVRFYPNLLSSIEFNGNAAALQSEFILPK